MRRWGDNTKQPTGPGIPSAVECGRGLCSIYKEAWRTQRRGNVWATMA